MEAHNALIIDAIKEKSIIWTNLKNEVKKIIIGQEAIIDRIFIAILCNSHALLEGAPGLAKTTLIKTIAKTLSLSFQRIQFTPDLLPADVIGTLIYNPKNNDFGVKKGPIFANIVLADEINRAPAKVQSALLEAMQEHQVTIGDTTYTLDEPFFVLATQNPIDQEGTYRLPEAQIDRFMFKLLVTYPKIHEEKEILQNIYNPKAVYPILDKEGILASQKLIQDIYIDDKVIDYILTIVAATRSPKDYHLNDLTPLIQYGASPRASIALSMASKAYAFLKKRHFVIPDDVKTVAPDVLRHRIIPSYEAEAEDVSTDFIVQKILKTLTTP